MQRQVVEFSKYNPSGNMTILVHSKHQPSEYLDDCTSVDGDNTCVL